MLSAKISTKDDIPDSILCQDELIPYSVTAQSICRVPSLPHVIAAQSGQRPILDGSEGETESSEKKVQVLAAYSDTVAHVQLEVGVYF